MDMNSPDEVSTGMVETSSSEATQDVKARLQQQVDLRGKASPFGRIALEALEAIANLELLRNDTLRASREGWRYASELEAERLRLNASNEALQAQNDSLNLELGNPVDVEKWGAHQRPVAGSRSPKLVGQDAVGKKPLRAALVTMLGAQVVPGVRTFQQRVQPWLLACFGPKISAGYPDSEDTKERNHRFLEEALELVQACGATAVEAHQLVDYVYGRPVGEKNQEVGGVMITVAALCLAQGLDMHEAGETELARVWTKIAQIREKQATKPKNSPLPAAPARPLLPLSVIQALRFYANGDHFVIDEATQEFDTVSGEPANWLMSTRDGDATMIEDGSIARSALLGQRVSWNDGGEDVASLALEHEAYGAIADLAGSEPSTREISPPRQGQ